MIPFKEAKRAPKTRIVRLTSEKVGNATGRESYEFGTPVVVAGVTTCQEGWESRPHGSAP